MIKKQELLKIFQEIPWVGPNLAEDLVDLGYKSISELKTSDQEKMFDKLCALRGQKIDRCVLYVFRCAKYYAKTKKHSPELLKWWNWKDKTI
ncbi:MAG: pathogenicity locus [Elusimicrobia bacterium RIFOXYA2_FULL_40_6]|nr:MAG: pathogenicity locus [Elusimicrobia bacterium RIFOXYA2_FULL_40_6]